MNSSKMSRHVVLSVKFLMTNFAWVRIPLKMCCYIMPVEIAWMRIGIVANFATIGVLGWTFVGAKTSDADRIVALWRPEPIRTICIKVSQFGFNLFLHLEIHQIRRGAGRARF